MTQPIHAYVRTRSELIIECARYKTALNKIIWDRERNPKAAPGICDECARRTFEHEEWCAAAIAHAALNEV